MNQGVSLIEVIVAVFLITLIFVGILGGYALLIKLISFYSAKSIALTIAQEKLEAIKSLNYQEIGTIGGIPSGNIPPEEEIVRNNLKFKVETSVSYVDDPADQLAPQDPQPGDYKRIRIKVSFQNPFPGQVSLETYISGPNAEEISGGTLKIKVINFEGVGVFGAKVELKNPTLSPSIDSTYYTDQNGEVLISALPEAIESYKVIVSKEGYSSDRTYGRDGVANPLKPHLTVLTGKVTEASFAIDKVSSLKVSSVLASNPETKVPYLTFNLRGEKIIGTDSLGQPIYKYQNQLTTSENGEILISNLEGDIYHLSLDPDTGITLEDTSPPQPITLPPNSYKEVKLLVSSANYLWVKAIDASTSEPIFGAQVKLENQETGYQQIQPTDSKGETVFLGLESGTYTLEISHPSYQTFTQSLNISGATSYEAKLNPR